MGGSPSIYRHTHIYVDPQDMRRVCFDLSAAQERERERDRQTDRLTDRSIVGSNSSAVLAVSSAIQQSYTNKIINSNKKNSIYLSLA